MIKIRNAEKADFNFILKLNKENVKYLAPMDEKKLELLSRLSRFFLVAEFDGQPAAFLLALREGCKEYDSENYIWFNNHYDSFLYIDRIVIDDHYRHQGIGVGLYEYIFEKAKAENISFVTAEVDIIPYNENSLKFHEAMGFVELGQQVIRAGEVKVSLKGKSL